jgi:hypothetical protein
MRIDHRDGGHATSRACTEEGSRAGLIAWRFDRGKYLVLFSFLAQCVHGVSEGSDHTHTFLKSSVVRIPDPEYCGCLNSRGAMQKAVNSGSYSLFLLGKFSCTLTTCETFA